MKALPKGDWVAGFASKELVKNALKFGVKLTEGALVYLMRITEDPMPLCDYFNDCRYTIKKPIQTSPNPIMRQGDNIYYHGSTGKYAQLPNSNHEPSYLAHDISGKNVLISKEFYYFGRNALIPPGGWKSKGKIKGRTFIVSGAWRDEIFDLIKNKSHGVYGDPCLLDINHPNQSLQETSCIPAPAQAGGKVFPGITTQCRTGKSKIL